jgi:hypothetical protein
MVVQGRETIVINRIIAAVTFRKGVYAEVEKDASFTTTAWALVAVVALVNRLGAYASSSEWLVVSIGATVFAVFGFCVGALVISWVGRTLFRADITFNEAVRTLGLAYIWQALGVLGMLTALSEAFSCMLTPLRVIAWILMIVAWFIAAREALDLDWAPAIVTVVLGWLAQIMVTTVVGGLVLGLLELGGGVMGGLFGF